jgi:hypothetical protein
MDAAVRTLFKASKPEYQKQEDERKKRVGNGLTSMPLPRKERSYSACGRTLGRRFQAAVSRSPLFRG